MRFHPVDAFAAAIIICQVTHGGFSDARFEGSERKLTGKANFGSMEGYENKNDGSNSGAVLCRRGSVLRRRRTDGPWKLNDAKSKLASGMSKLSTVVYEAAGENMKVTVDGTNSDGKPMHNEWTGKFDGKDHPVTGDPTSDARSYKKVDDRTLDLTVKKDGKVTVSGRIAVSADGKTRTVTTNGTDPQGKQFTGTAVHDKQ